VRFRALASSGVAVVVAGLALAGPATAATLYIPRIGLFTEVNTRSIDAGPMAYFRDADTVAIAGHRTTHSRPFYNLERLRKGDLVRAGASTPRDQEAGRATLGALATQPCGTCSLRLYTTRQCRLQARRRGAGMSPP
jgi:hypothetical protein